MVPPASVSPRDRDIYPQENIQIVESALRWTQEARQKTIDFLEGRTLVRLQGGGEAIEKVREQAVEAFTQRFTERERREIEHLQDAMGSVEMRLRRLEANRPGLLAQIFTAEGREWGKDYKSAKGFVAKGASLIAEAQVALDRRLEEMGLRENQSKLVRHQERAVRRYLDNREQGLKSDLEGFQEKLGKAPEVKAASPTQEAVANLFVSQGPTVEVAIEQALERSKALKQPVNLQFNGGVVAVSPAVDTAEILMNLGADMERRYEAKHGRAPEDDFAGEKWASQKPAEEGQRIDTYLQEVIDAADHLGINIKCEFNGITMTIPPQANVSSALIVYGENCHREGVEPQLQQRPAKSYAMA